MKATVALVLTTIFLTGCQLLPSRVEYFKKKVQSVPEPTEKHIEVQREAASYVADKTEQTVMAAISEGSTSNVLKPAVDSALVAKSLTGSLGKPEDKWTGPAKSLASRLDAQDAKLEAMMRDFKERNDKMEGKAVEGTGLFSMGYFTQLGILFIVLFLGWIALKIFGMVALAGGNPVVSVGTKMLEGTGKSVANVAAKGFSELIEGGENFVKKVNTHIEDPATREKVLTLFKGAHMEAQSRDIQDVVKKLKGK